MDAKEVSFRLAQQAEAVCQLLLPNGKKRGREYKAADVQDSHTGGDSLSVCLEKGKAGVWSDFATGESGDLLDLWQASRGVSFVEALAQAKRWLGVDDRPLMPDNLKTYARPERPKCQPVQGEVMAYLTQERKLTPETIAIFKVAQQGDVIIFPYLRDGELVRLKFRKVDKSKMWVSPDSEPCLFGWQALDPAASSVVITEGELDAMTLHQLGIPALSLPMGCGKGGNQGWIDYEFQRLERFKDIVLCMDDDEPGQAVVEELITRLGRHRCRLMSLPGKDPNECLQNGIQPGVFHELYKLAPDCGHPILAKPSDFLKQVIDEFYPPPGFVDGVPTPWSKMGDKVRFRTSELSIWTGLNGHGKSQALGQVILHTALQGERICIASMELPPRRLLKRLVRQATAMRLPSIPYIQEAIGWTTEKIWLLNELGTVDVEKLFDAFIYARKRFNCRYFVIDSLMKCGIAEDDYKGQKAFLERITEFNHGYDCHTHLVAHSRKRESEHFIPGKMDVKGTGAITDLADMSFSVWRNKKREEELQLPEAERDPKNLSGSDCIISCDKNRNGEWEGNIYLAFDKDSFQFLESEHDKPKRYVPFSTAVSNAPAF